MIVPSLISILAFTSVALASTSHREIVNNKRQTVNVTPSVALAASIQANFAIAQIIIAIVAAAQQAAALISSISAASVARTAITSTATSSIASSVTSIPTNTTSTTSAPVASATGCRDPTLDIYQLQQLASATPLNGTCAKFDTQLSSTLSACYNSTTPVPCACSNSTLSVIASLASCQDMATNSTRNAQLSYSYCSACVTGGFASQSVCGPVQPVLPYCALSSAVASATSTSTSAAPTFTANSTTMANATMSSNTTVSSNSTIFNSTVITNSTSSTNITVKSS